MRTPVEPRALDEGTIGVLGASESAEHQWMHGDRVQALGVVMVELVRRIPDPRDRAAVQMAVMEGMSYADAAELMAAEVGYVPDMKTVWRWAQRGLDYIAEVVEHTAWLKELAPHLPVQHPEPPPVEVVPLEDRLTGDRADGEPAEEEGHPPRDVDGEAG